jgi:NADH:ubiquinone oxidoreductase subunit B-like Fe-S oxidoreductase
MQEITYASKCIVTTDAVADALLELVTAINRHDHSEAVTVPAFTDEGDLIDARMTLDASSELVAVPVELDIDQDPSVADALEAAVSDLRKRIVKNRPENSFVAHAVAEPGAERETIDFDDF